MIYNEDNFILGFLKKKMCVQSNKYKSKLLHFVQHVMDIKLSWEVYTG